MRPRSLSGGGRRGYRAQLRRGGPNLKAICRDCQREDRFRFDLACLSGYARPVAGHFRCLARIMAQARGVQTGAYAEALLAEFDQALSEVQEVIDSEKGSKDKKIFFQAVEAKKEILEAKAKALGLGASPGRPAKGENLPLPDDLSREDLHEVAKAFLKAQEQPPAPPQEAASIEAAEEPSTDGQSPDVAVLGSDDERPTDEEIEAWIRTREAAVVDEAGSEGAVDEVTAMDGEGTSHPG